MPMFEGMNNLGGGEEACSQREVKRRREGSLGERKMLVSGREANSTIGGTRKLGNEGNR